MPHLLKQPAPAGWLRSPLLHHHRVFVLEGGATVIGRFVVQLDPELGVVVTNREEAELES